MSSDHASAAYVEIMRLVNEMDAQSSRFEADIDNRMTGMMRRQHSRPPKAAASANLDASDDMKSYIASYVKLIRDTGVA